MSPLISPSMTRSRSLAGLAADGHPVVLIHQPSQSEQQPRIVGPVVVTHGLEILPVRDLVAETQMTAHRLRVRQGHRRSVRVRKRARPRQQQVVAGFVRLVMRGGNEQQRLRVVGEPLSAAERSLQMRQQLGDAIEVRTGVAGVPRAHRDEREQIQEVVIERHSERAGIGAAVADSARTRTRARRPGSCWP